MPLPLPAVVPVSTDSSPSRAGLSKLSLDFLCSSPNAPAVEARPPPPLLPTVSVSSSSSSASPSPAPFDHLPPVDPDDWRTLLLSSSSSRKRARSESPDPSTSNGEEGDEEEEGEERPFDPDTAEGGRYAGMPSRASFEEEVEVYYQSLHPSKRSKALMSPSLHSLCLRILLSPRDTSLGDPQLRFWIRQRLKLISSPGGDTMQLNGRTVVLRDEIYDRLVEAHREVEHKGRDKTFAVVKARYAYVPKELVAAFVKHCPVCHPGVSRRR
ncbi:hypothetical protein JCM8547_004380 [Rhodosporidiobolus lusitaniae]